MRVIMCKVTLGVAAVALLAGCWGAGTKFAKCNLGVPAFLPAKLAAL